ncbi:MAG: DUF86 domain-containing protein [Actinomycetota bacterium]|nr:DUF86 domain-containing protein [Actinomycetota bacterium]
MTRRDERALLWDLITHGKRAIAFMDARSLDQYLEDRLVRSAVEREVAIIGEAYGALDQLRADLVNRLPGDVRAVVGMRNVLVHGYAQVEDSRIHSIVADELPPLVSSAEELLFELGGEAPSRP